MAELLGHWLHLVVNLRKGLFFDLNLQRRHIRCSLGLSPDKNQDNDSEMKRAIDLDCVIPVSAEGSRPDPQIHPTHR